MDITLLFISISLSSLGSFLDDYTSRIFIRDLGIEFEANKLRRNVIKKHGYKRWLLCEAVLIILFGIFDSLRSTFSFIAFFGLVFLVARGLIATYNLRNIVEYRAMGIDVFKERDESHRQAFQNTSKMNTVKYVLPYLVEALICFVIYAILRTFDFPLVILSRSLVLGLAYFFIVMAS